MDVSVRLALQDGVRIVILSTWVVVHTMDRHVTGSTYHGHGVLNCHYTR